MKRYIAMLSVICTLPSIAFAQNDTPKIEKCPGENAIDCIISNFKDKKDVSGSIGNGNTLQITIDKKNKNQITLEIQNTIQKQIKECTADASTFFKVQATLDEIKENKSPNFSYMKCSDKVLQIDPPTPKEVKIPLKVESFKPIDANTLVLAFNQNIQHSTVGVRIIDRKDYTMLPVKNYTADGSKAVRIHLDKPLLADNEYNMTINTVLGENQTTIERGIDSIQTFTTPADLEGAPNIKKEEVPVPPTETATGREIEYTKAHPEGVPTQQEATGSQEQTATGETEAIAEEDPKTSVQTGMSATVLMIAMALCAAALLSFRRKKS